ncbi:sugar phosphate isomerase/epimerase family protein [Pseudonocardia lutea]|uniref:Sugar phosphate isomerase/epimerase family protein n=1 Tax=Pseudonocardia lutea TaxID=2172015 RepID=A0ABW1IBN6_9PSEU
MGTVGQVPFAERLSAAAAGGYVAMSVLPLETLQDAEEIRRRAADEGVGLSAVDPLAGWLPDWAPTPHTGRDREAFLRPLAALDMDRVLGAAAAAGCKDVSVIEPYGRPVPVDLGSEAFAEVCDRAAAHGLSARLEAMPFSGIPDIGTAWDIVQRAGRQNGGLVVDTWHLFRGGFRTGLLDEIPVERITLQLCDAPLVPASDLWVESGSRLLPGAGELDLTSVVSTLRRRGFTGPVGPEVVSPALAHLGPHEAALRAARACRPLLDHPLPDDEE